MTVLVWAMLSLQRRLYQTAKRNGWYDTEPSFSDIIAMCHCELSEAMEAYRIHGNPAADDVAAELADCVMRIMSHLGRHDVDIERLIVAKDAFNRNRGHRHGGKHV